MLLRSCTFLFLLSSGLILQAQNDGPDPDFAVVRDAKTGLSGIVDASGNTVWHAEFINLRPAGKKLVLGFKPADADGYILGTGGRMKRVPHAELWRSYKEALLNSDIADRQLIVRVLDMNADPIGRLKELENIELTYRVMGAVREEVVGKLVAD